MTPLTASQVAIGMAWWNSRSEVERGYWLERAGSAVAADAYACMQREIDPNYCRICTPAGHACYCQIACDE